jgi:hypothetical protein
MVISMPMVMNLHAMREYGHVLNMLKAVKRIEWQGSLV